MKKSKKMKSPKPQKCPWCGGAPKVTIGTWPWVYCINFDCWASAPRCHSRDDAIRAWNRITLKREKRGGKGTR